MHHMIISAIVHGLIYRVIWAAERGLGVPATIAVAVVGIGIIWVFFYKKKGNYRNRSQK